MAHLVSDWMPPLPQPQPRRWTPRESFSEFCPVLPVVAPQALTIVLEAELAGANKGWTDISVDTNLGASQFTLEYGIFGGGPLDRIAAVGSLSWAMSNATSNTSGGLNGYYTPGHTNARSGWDIGIAIRLKIGFGGLWYYKFRGTLVDVEPDTGLFRRRAAVCRAHDWMAESLNSFIRDTAVQTDKRSDEIISTIITNSARRQPTARSFRQGQTTFAFALDNLRDEKTPLMRAIADVVYSEIGYFYVKGDNLQGGTVRFEDRHARPLSASVATFDKTMFELHAKRSRDDIVNHVNAIIHPRRVDAAATTVLYELTTTDTRPKILPGETMPLTVYFRDATGRFVRVGATSIVTPVAGTDYIANTAADGSGSVITSDLSLSFSSTSNTGTLSFTNNGGVDAYLTTLQVRGKAVADRYELGVFKHNTTSEDTFGELDLNYDMLFEDRAEYALAVCDWFLSLYGGTTLKMHIPAMTVKADDSETALLTQILAREPGDKITITESMAGISAITYFINGVRITIKPGQIFDSQWVLAPADQQQSWLLEDPVAGLLEISTVLGFV